MTNEELCLDIIETLGNKYQVGLHNSTKKMYVYKSRFDCEKFNIDEDIVTEDKIIESILKKGLFVPCRSFGLSSTITFLSNIKPDSFNYSYYKTDSDKRYVLIIAIPNYIHVDGIEYFIGDLIEDSSIINYALFSKIVPREFIYGYYVKTVVDKEKELYADDFDFYLNDKFYGFMFYDEQEDFWNRYFQENDIDMFIFKSNKSIVGKINEIRQGIKNRTTKRRIIKKLKK